jgi:hypothetical protein
MAINPELITTIRVDQLPDETLTLTNLFPHTVGTELKSATIQELVDLVATSIGVSGGVGYLPISVTDGQQLPNVPESPGFFLCGAGTFLNINGFPNIICTENLNAIMSLTDHWELAVEIPINPLSGSVQSVTGSAVDNTDPLNPVINEIIYGVQNIIEGTNITVDNTDPANPIISATGGGITPDLQEVLLEGDRPIKKPKGNYTFEDADRGKYFLVKEEANLTLNPGTLAANSELLIKKSGEDTFDVKLIAAVGVTIYFNDTEITNGDFLTIEQDDLFILKQDGSTDKWYLSIISSSQTSTPRLSDVLTESNETDGNDIAISDGDKIVLDNGANLKKGTTDAGLGGSKGIALRCAVDYELKWEAGRLYVMEGDGFTIREVSHNFTTIPTENDDDSKGFVVGSRWILDNGDVYLCGDATTGFAVWEIVNTGTTPTLQEVTSAGNSSFSPIILNNDVSSEYLELANNYILFRNTGFKYIGLQPLSPPTSAKTIYIPDANGLMALTDDIPTLVAGSGIDIDDTDPLNPIISATGGGGGGVPYTGATQNLDLGTHTLLAKDLVINHPSGSGVAASITKGGSGEALTVVKTSGSGNAASITGGFTLLDELHLTTDLADAYIASASTWNAKQNALNYTPYRFVNATQATYLGSVVGLAETTVAQTTILGGTFNATDFMRTFFKLSKPTTAFAVTTRIRVNTTNNLVGATQIAVWNIPTTATYSLMPRHINLFGGNGYSYNSGSSLLSDVVAVSTAGTTFTYDTTNDLFVFFTIQFGSVADSITFQLANISN